MIPVAGLLAQVGPLVCLQMPLKRRSPSQSREAQGGGSRLKVRIHSKWRDEKNSQVYVLSLRRRRRNPNVNIVNITTLQIDRRLDIIS